MYIHVLRGGGRGIREDGVIKLEIRRDLEVYSPISHAPKSLSCELLETTNFAYQCAPDTPPAVDSINDFPHRLATPLVSLPLDFLALPSLTDVAEFGHAYFESYIFYILIFRACIHDISQDISGILIWNIIQVRSRYSMYFFFFFKSSAAYNTSMQHYS